MQEFRRSPFDQMILDSWQHILENPSFSKCTDLGNFIYSQVKILRTIFINYCTLNRPTNFENGGNRTATSEEMISMSDRGIKVGIDYFLFVSQLNQIGRVLKKKFGIEIPKFAEIRFFRNKIVEHWDEYLSCQIAGSAVQHQGRLAVPTALGTEAGFTEGQKARMALELALNNHTNDPICLEGLYYEDYADVIYPMLMSIRPELDSNKGAKHPPKSTLESLVELLFKYNFPLPIYDVEQYCKDLVVFFSSQKLTV